MDLKFIAAAAAAAAAAFVLYQKTVTNKRLRVVRVLPPIPSLSQRARRLHLFFRSSARQSS